MDQILGSHPSSKSTSSSSFLSCKVYKNDSLEEFSQCRYGSSCEFAHGKEEIRPFKSHINSTPKCLKCDKLHNHRHQVIDRESPFQKVTSTRPPNLPRAPKKKKFVSTTTGTDWPPSHDAISVDLPPSSLSMDTNPPLVKDGQNSAIDTILYGSTPPKIEHGWSPFHDGINFDLTYFLDLLDSNPPSVKDVPPSLSIDGNLPSTKDVQHSAIDNLRYDPTPHKTDCDWSPSEDGVGVELATFSIVINNPPSAKDVQHSAMDNVLYGPTRRKVDGDWCPSDDGIGVGLAPLSVLIDTNPSLVKDAQNSFMNFVLYGPTPHKIDCDWSPSDDGIGVDLPPFPVSINTNRLLVKDVL